MAARGRTTNKRATATKRKKPVLKIRSGSAKSAKPKSAKSKSVKPKSVKSKSVKLKSRKPKPSHSKSENTRLKSEIRAARDRQAASVAVMRLIGASSGDAGQTLRRIAEITERLFGASSVSLLIADGERWGQTIRVGAGSERIAASIPLAHVAITPQFMPGAVYLENRQVHVADSDDPLAIARWPGLVPARAAGTRTMSGTPLRREGAAIGALIVHRNRLEPFTAEELELQQSFADQAVIAIENARLFNESKEALARQTATSDILRVISESPTDVQPVFDAIVLTAVRLLRCDWSSFLLCDSVSFWPAASAGPEGPRPVGHGKAPIDPDANFPSRAIALKKTLHLPDWSLIDLPEHERRIHERTGTNSALFLPLLREGECTGLLALTGKRAGIFGEGEIALAESFRDQAVIAIENARLFNEVQARTADLSESLQQQTATADVLKVISRSVFDLQTVLDTLVESAYKLCGAKLGLLYLRGDEAFECKAIAGVGVAEASLLFKGRPIRAGRGTAAERVILTGEVQSITDFFEDPEMDPKVRETIRNANSSDSSVGQIRSTLAVPMTRDSVVVGVMVIARSQTGPFPQRQIELLRSFADQAVIAIENARLFDEVQAKTRDLGEALQQQTATADVLKVISRSAFDLDSVLATLVTSAAKLCEAEKGVIFLREDNSYHLVSNHGFSPEFEAFAKANPFPADSGSTTTRAAASGAVVQVVDVLEDQTRSVLVREYQRLGGYRTNLGVPLRREGETVGVFMLARQVVRAFTPRQIELVETFADQAVIAIENVRLFDEVQARTKELAASLTYQTGSSNILKVIASSPTAVEPVLKAIVESACELCEADDALATLKEGTDLVFQAQHGSIPVVWERQPISREWVSGRSVIERATVHVHDLLAPDGEQFPEGREFARRSMVRTVLSVPLLSEGESIGAIVLRRTEVRPFSEKQIALLQTFADQAVIAIGNVRLFEQVQARTRELTKSLEDLRTTQDRLVQTEKLASLGQLTAGIAHEIKNPLNFVNNFSALSAELIDELNDMLKPAALDDKVRDEIGELTQMLKGNLEKVVQHGKRADSIVKNMLLHSREGSGEHRSVDVNAILDESLNLAYHGARAEKPGFNITLQRDFDADVTAIEAFPQEITRVFLNLITNGFYAAAKRKSETPDSGFEPLLRATTKNIGDAVEIRIRDNGTGIPDEVKEKIFNPFFTTKPAGEGTGLGLSMSHDIIVKQHGGSIDVTTLPGQFTEFTIILPKLSNFPDKD